MCVLSHNHLCTIAWSKGSSGQCWLIEVLQIHNGWRNTVEKTQSRCVATPGAHTTIFLGPQVVPQQWRKATTMGKSHNNGEKPRQWGDTTGYLWPLASASATSTSTTVQTGLFLYNTRPHNRAQMRNRWQQVKGIRRSTTSEQIYANYNWTAQHQMIIDLGRCTSSLLLYPGVSVDTTS